MNFSSHVHAVVIAAVHLVNALTPGEAHGQGHAPPEGIALAGAATSALRSGVNGVRELSQHEAGQLRMMAPRLREVFTALDAGDLDAAAHTVNRLLLATGARPWLDHHDGEPWHLHFHGPQDSPALGWVAGCATALGIMLGSGQGHRLGVCTAPRCDRVYLDTSRNGTRRFCSTSCQNRVKAAAFRARQA